MTDLALQAIPIPARVAERAASRYVEDERGHWISTLSLNGPEGYAQITWRDEGGVKRLTTAHRAAWQYHHGPIPGLLTVDHECRVKRCVRPNHLRLLTRADNGRDGSLFRHGRTP